MRTHFPLKWERERHETEKKHEAHIVRWLESCHDYFLLDFRVLCLRFLEYQLFVMFVCYSPAVCAFFSLFSHFAHWQNAISQLKIFRSNIYSDTFFRMQCEIFGCLLVLQKPSNAREMWPMKTVALKLHSKSQHISLTCWIVELVLPAA